jgi:hypothetical protein
MQGVIKKTGRSLYYPAYELSGSPWERGSAGAPTSVCALLGSRRMRLEGFWIWVGLSGGFGQVWEVLPVEDGGSPAATPRQWMSFWVCGGAVATVAR